MRFLDFQKVKDSERSKAKELFGTKDAPTELAQKVRIMLACFFPNMYLRPSQISAVRSNKSLGFGGQTSATNGAGKNYRIQLNEKERKRVEQLIRNAKSFAEITRLEKELNEGRIPGGIAEDGMDTS